MLIVVSCSSRAARAFRHRMRFWTGMTREIWTRRIELWALNRGRSLRILVRWTAWLFGQFWLTLLFNIRQLIILLQISGTVRRGRFTGRFALRTVLLWLDFFRFCWLLKQIRDLIINFRNDIALICTFAFVSPLSGETGAGVFSLLAFTSPFDTAADELSMLSCLRLKSSIFCLTGSTFKALSMYLFGWLGFCLIVKSQVKLSIVEVPLDSSLRVMQSIANEISLFKRAKLTSQKCPNRYRFYRHRQPCNVWTFL